MRYIDADAMKEWVKKYSSVFTRYDWREILEMIQNAPTVDIDAITETHERIGFDKGFREGYAQAMSEVRHGRWIKNEDRSGWHCSCCGKDDLYAYPYTQNNERELQDFYCPNCGAKMDEVEDNEIHRR